MKTLFFTILIGVGLYLGYQIVTKDKILGPRIRDVATDIKTTAGIKTAEEAKSHCAITFLNPQNGDTVTSPVALQVVVDNSKQDCSWTVFEAQAGVVELIGNTDQVLTKEPLMATSDWMTAAPVTYTANLEYLNYAGPLKLRIVEENPSGVGTPDEVSLLLNAQ